MDEPVSVGRYRVEKIIGKGAMGVVYQAFDPHIERMVALKTVRVQEGLKPEEIKANRERFLKEAQAAGKLLHPNIVTVFDVFEDSGTLYIAMEYVEGELLEQFCSKPGLLLPQQAVKLVMQGLSALNFAHLHHIVHRDIKPTNLMVMDKGETLKVMDFGVARMEGAGLTQTGFVVGTPHYMSPEQIEGQELDGRSDIFSMGVVLYELLSGERPFNGDTISTVIYHILNKAPAPVCTVMPSLPRRLNLVLDKALAKNQQDRFATAEDFRKALGAVLDGMESDEEDDFGYSSTGSTMDMATGAMPESLLPSPPVRETKKKKSRLGKRVLLWIFILAILGSLGWLAMSEIPRRIIGGESIKKAIGPAHEKFPRFITVKTDPPGAKLFLDGDEVDAVTLPPDDKKKHEIEARLGCLSARQVLEPDDGVKSVNLKLGPGPFSFELKSEPEGASIQVDGQDTGLLTPAGIPRNDCSSFKVKLTLEGWQPEETSIDPKDTGTMIVPLKKEPAKGTLRLTSGSGNMLIYEGKKPLGRTGSNIELPVGKHELTVVDPGVRGRRSISVEVKPGKTTSVKVAPFKTGKVFLYGKPASEGKVIVDGSTFDELPLNGVRPVATGKHRFKVVDPGGNSVSFIWDIRTGEQTRIVDFAENKVETP